MLVDSRRNLGMRQLHEQGPSSSQEEDVLAVHPPGDGAFFEQACAHDPSLFTSPLAGEEFTSQLAGEVGAERRMGSAEWGEYPTKPWG